MHTDMPATYMYKKWNGEKKVARDGAKPEW